jgi:hypothetical protein
MTEAQNPQDRRRQAYAAGADVAKARMRAEAPLDAEALERVEASDVVIVRGTYDHVEQVLDALAMPYTAIAPEQLGAVSLRPEQLLVVNCPGAGLERVAPVIHRFVRDGGSLFTTDWALRHVLEPAFPGVLEYNQRPTRDDVVRIQVRSQDNPFLRGVMDGSDDPQWWLEASSYPIRVLDPGRVEVLLDSTELGQRYGEPAVAVLFREGDGEVFHMISHYYLQRTELRNARHSMAATAYAAEKGVAASPEMAGLRLGEVESAATSARWVANVLAQKKRRTLEQRRGTEEE